MTKKEKLIENMDINLGELLNEIHYMEIAIERMKEKFENKGGHYLFILEYYRDMVKIYRLYFARFTNLRNLAVAAKPTLEVLEMYNDMIEDVKNNIFNTSEYVWCNILDECIDDYVEDYND